MGMNLFLLTFKYCWFHFVCFLYVVAFCMFYSHDNRTILTRIPSRTRYKTHASLRGRMFPRYYLEQRKITHLHFKVQRAETLD